MHEKSKLQLVWSMTVLRPYGVSIGCTDRQLLFVPTVAAALADPFVDDDPEVGVASLPRLRARRFSAAHA